MLKLVGACLVLVASFLYGFQLRQQLSLHVKQLMGLKEILLIISGEISYARTPLEEVFSHIGERGIEPFGSILSEMALELKKDRKIPLRELWDTVINNHKEELVFSKEEMKMFLDIGGSLGFQDVKMQINHIELFIHQVDKHLEKAQGELKEKQKVYQYLSVMSGLFLILILI